MKVFISLPFILNSSQSNLKIMKSLVLKQPMYEEHHFIVRYNRLFDQLF